MASDVRVTVYCRGRSNLSFGREELVSTWDYRGAGGLFRKPSRISCRKWAGRWRQWDAEGFVADLQCVRIEYECQ